LFLCSNVRKEDPATAVDLSSSTARARPSRPRRTPLLSALLISLAAPRSQVMAVEHQRLNGREDGRLLQLTTEERLRRTTGAVVARGIRLDGHLVTRRTQPDRVRLVLLLLFFLPAADVVPLTQAPGRQDPPLPLTDRTTRGTLPLALLTTRAPLLLPILGVPPLARRSILDSRPSRTTAADEHQILARWPADERQRTAARPAIPDETIVARDRPTAATKPQRPHRWPQMTLATSGVRLRLRRLLLHQWVSPLHFCGCVRSADVCSFAETSRLRRLPSQDALRSSDPLRRRPNSRRSHSRRFLKPLRRRTDSRRVRRSTDARRLPQRPDSGRLRSCRNAWELLSDAGELRGSSDSSGATARISREERGEGGAAAGLDRRGSQGGFRQVELSEWTTRRAVG
jgi:hypothetical protein